MFVFLINNFPDSEVDTKSKFPKFSSGDYTEISEMIPFEDGYGTQLKNRIGCN